MTEHPDDELASAYLDGELTDDERARVDGDPELSDLVARMRDARDRLVAEPIEYPTPALKEDAIRAALASSPIIDLGAERARRRMRIASVAAAVVVAVGVFGVLVSLSDSSDDNKNAATAAAAPTTTGARGSAELAGGGAAPAFDATADQAPDFLGTFTDRADLVAAIQDHVALGRTTSQSQSETLAAGPATCAVTPPPDTVGQVLSATAVLDGRTVQIDVYRATDGSLWILVTNVDGCTTEFSQSQ